MHRIILLINVYIFEEFFIDRSGDSIYIPIKNRTYIVLIQLLGSIYVRYTYDTKIFLTYTIILSYSTKINGKKRKKIKREKKVQKSVRVGYGKVEM